MDKKEEIINAMEKLFSKIGYSSSISDLAKAVGLKPSSIYSHFESKDQIIYQVLMRETQTYYNLFLEKFNFLKGKDTENCLKELFFFTFNYYRKNNKLSLWTHVGHISNLELKRQILELKEDTERKTGLIIYDIFISGAKNKEIKEDNLEGAILLYFASLSGGIVTYGLENEDPKLIDAKLLNIWNTYWKGRKLS